MPGRGGSKQTALGGCDSRSRSPPATPKVPPPPRPYGGGARQASRAAAAASSSDGLTRASRPVGTIHGGQPNTAVGSDFRSLVSDMFLKNECSGHRIQQLCQKAATAGATVVTDLGSAGAGGTRSGNSSRDLLRRILKQRDVPTLYWAQVSLKDPETKDEQQEWLPFVLPHEVFSKMVESKPALVFREQASQDLCLNWPRLVPPWALMGQL